MALQNIEALKGLGSLVIANYATGVPITILQSADDIKISPKVDKAVLQNSRGLLDEDIGQTSYEMSFTAYEYPIEFLEKAFAGLSTTFDAGPSIKNLAVVTGTAYSATTGVANVTITSTGDAKPGWYAVKAKTATTVSLYGTSDVSYADGSDQTVTNNTMLIQDDISITTGGVVAIAGFGFSFTGGSGTIGMTVGDSFEFYVHGSLAGWEHKVGIANTSYNYVSAVASARKKNGLYRFVKIHKFLLEPVEINMGKDYSKYEIKATLLYDSSKDSVYSLIKS
jgi:hypothetical protein